MKSRHLLSSKISSFCRFVVSSIREDSFCCFTTFVDFFVVCLSRRTFRFEILFLSVRVSRRAIKK